MSRYDFLKTNFNLLGKEVLDRLTQSTIVQVIGTTEEFEEDSQTNRVIAQVVTDKGDKLELNFYNKKPYDTKAKNLEDVLSYDGIGYLERHEALFDVLTGGNSIHYPISSHYKITKTITPNLIGL
jgi:hypothetical protein